MKSSSFTFYRLFALISFVALPQLSVALADDAPIVAPAPIAAPECDDHHQAIAAFNNAQLLAWKADPSVPNQFLARGFAHGPVVRVYPDKCQSRKDGAVGTCHTHFAIQIGETAGDAVEVIYSEDFGKMAPVRLGQDVQACGDFIKSIAATEANVASPDGAIIHWVHASHSRSHDSGFVLIDGKLYGAGHDSRPDKGGPSKKPSQGKGSADATLESIKIVPPADLGCLKLDTRGVAENPNFGIKGTPYNHYFGFVFDGEKVWKVPGADSSEVAPDKTASSLESFLKSSLQNDKLSRCLAVGPGAETGTQAIRSSD